MEDFIDGLLADDDSVEIFAAPPKAAAPEPKAAAPEAKAAAPGAPLGGSPAPPVLIGIRGDMGVGKDTLAAEICREYPAFRTAKFAAKLRAAAALIADIPVERTESAEDKAVDLSRQLRPAVDMFARVQRAIELVTGEPADRCIAAQMYVTLTGFAAARPDKMAIIPLTVGRLLQVLGTECFRTLVGPNVWVKVLFAGCDADGRPPTVIADTRFPNESAAIRARGGVVVLVRRRARQRARVGPRLRARPRRRGARPRDRQRRERRGPHSCLLRGCARSPRGRRGPRLTGQRFRPERRTQLRVYFFAGLYSFSASLAPRKRIQQTWPTRK